MYTSVPASSKSFGNTYAHVAAQDTLTNKQTHTFELRDNNVPYILVISSPPALLVPSSPSLSLFPTSSYNTFSFVSYIHEDKYTYIHKLVYINTKISIYSCVAKPSTHQVFARILETWARETASLPSLFLSRLPGVLAFRRFTPICSYTPYNDPIEITLLVYT